MDTLRVLDETPERLAEVEGLGGEAHRRRSRSGVARAARDPRRHGLPAGARRLARARAAHLQALRPERDQRRLARAVPPRHRRVGRGVQDGRPDRGGARRRAGLAASGSRRACSRRCATRATRGTSYVPAHELGGARRSSCEVDGESAGRSERRWNARSTRSRSAATSVPEAARGGTDRLRARRCTRPRRASRARIVELAQARGATARRAPSGAIARVRAARRRGARARAARSRERRRARVGARGDGRAGRRQDDDRARRSSRRSIARARRCASPRRRGARPSG